MEEPQKITLTEVKSGTTFEMTREEMQTLLGLEDDDEEGKAILEDFFGFGEESDSDS